MYSITVQRQKGATHVEELAISQRLPLEKWTRGASYRLGMPLKTVSTLCNNVYDVNNLCSHNVNNLVIAAIRTQGFVITGVTENKVVEIMIGSVSSILPDRGNLITGHKPNVAPQGLQLVSAAGNPILLWGKLYYQFS